MKRTPTLISFKKHCDLCGRNGHESGSCAAIPVPFFWKYGGNEVYVCGSFSQWQVKKKMVKEPHEKYFKLEIGLAPGIYQYKYIVDGEWKCDLGEPLTDDGVGGKNNIIEVRPLNTNEEEDEDQDYFIFIQSPHSQKQVKSKKITYQYPAIWVAIKGSWDNWKQEIMLKKVKNNFSGFMEFYVTLKIAPGSYEFKFIVDGHWLTSPNYPIVKGSNNIENNLLFVSSYGHPPQESQIINVQQETSLAWRREEGKWTECGRIHHTLQGHSISNICDLIYIFGGLANNKFTNTLYCYDPKSNEFSVVEDQKGDIPEPRAFHHASVFGTNMIVYGGFNHSYLTDYHNFNTVTHTWTKSDIDGENPAPRERATLAPYVEDKLVLFGGYYCSPDMEVETYLNDVYVLNLTLMEWVKPSVEGEAPPPRSAHTANFVKGKMFVFGGVTSQQKNFNDVYVLKTSLSGPFQWKKIEPKGIPPAPRHGHSAAVTGSNIIYYGGRGNGPKTTIYDDLFILDTSTGTWVVKASTNYRHKTTSKILS